MNSRTSRRFREAFDRLPREIQDRAREAYHLFTQNPQHPGLRFRKLRDDPPTYSVRITRGYRALGILEADTITWVWIGDHDRYEEEISRL